MGRGVRAGLLQFVVLLSLAVAPAAAQAAWTGVGSALATSSGALQLPSIATIGGVPYVAESRDGSLIVKHWNGTSWIQDGGALNVSPGSIADEQTIAGIGGVPYVAWEEHGPGPAQLYVKHWNGSAWVPNDDSLNLSSSSSTEPSIADIGGVPFVAFIQEGSPSALDVEHWDAAHAVWVDDGFTGVNSGDSLFNPSIVGIGGVPYLTFQENTSSAPTIFVKHLSNGSWIQDGAGLNALSGASDAAFTPTITGIGGVPYVAWAEDQNGQPAQAYVKRWNGTAWIPVGGSLNADTGGSIENAVSLLDIGGTPYAAVSQSVGSNFIVSVQRWTGADWETLGTVPAQGPAGSSGTALTNVAGVPFLAFLQVTGGSTGELDVAALAPDVSSEQAIATDTGALLVTRVKDYDTPLPIAFQYGRGSSLTTTTPSQSTDGTGSSTIVQAVTGLSPATSYSWRPVALAGANPFAFGPTQTFTTEPANGPGPAGAPGKTGATGATGPVGPAGQIELVTCKTGTKTVKRRVHGKLKPVKVKVVSCSTKLVSGPVKFTVATARAARLMRGKLVYARVELLRGARRTTLIVTHRLRKLRPGSYTLVAGRLRQTVRIR